jgi:hypothetical protein
MKEAIITFLAVITLAALVDCKSGGAGSQDGRGTYTQELWGEWVRMDTGDRWYITDSAITINDESSSTRASLTKQSERVIAVTEDGREYSLYAARTATASFTGVIAGNADAGSARAIGGGLGGVRVAIANLANKANELSATTDAAGVFTATGVIPGDSYLVTPDIGRPVTVTPSGDGEDMGVITVTSGVNFKTAIAPAQSSTSMNELYINQTYEFNLTFANVGTTDCYAPSYVVTAPSGVTVTGATQGILGTIEPDKSKSVQIYARCFAVVGDYEYKNISVTITDGTGKTWEDVVSLRFYRDSLTFNIRAEESISGIVITPDAKTYSFTGVTDGTVTAPLRMTGDYLVVFSGATIETETRYSLGVDVAADGNFGGFINTSRYEPNNTENDAVAITAPSLMAYLHKNDIDYYRVSYNNLDFLPAPTNTGASAAADAQVTVTWDAVTGAVNAGGLENARSAYSAVTTAIKTTITADSLSEALAWLSTNAVEGGDYSFTIRANESLAPQTLSYDGKTVGVTLDGGDAERTVSLSSNGSLFTIKNGVTLTLGENVTLQGRSDNTASLASVNGGTFTMSGGEISGNTATYDGGGVYVNGGTFTMNGGEISGNTATYDGGGVRVSYGTFTKQAGVIYGADAGVSLKNTARGAGYGHAVYIFSKKKRDGTVGEDAALNSTAEGAAGGWVEYATSIQIELQATMDDPSVADASLFANEAVQFSAGSGYASYQWYWNDEPIDGGVSADYTLAAGSKAPGIYELSVFVTTDAGEILSARCRVTVKEASD